MEGWNTCECEGFENIKTAMTGVPKPFQKAPKVGVKVLVGVNGERSDVSVVLDLSTLLPPPPHPEKPKEQFW